MDAGCISCSGMERTMQTTDYWPFRVVQTLYWNSLQYAVHFWWFGSMHTKRYIWSHRPVQCQVSQSRFRTLLQNAVLPYSQQTMPPVSRVPLPTQRCWDSRPPMLGHVDGWQKTTGTRSNCGNILMPCKTAYRTGDSNCDSGKHKGRVCHKHFYIINFWYFLVSLCLTRVLSVVFLTLSWPNLFPWQYLRLKLIKACYGQHYQIFPMQVDVDQVGHSGACRMRVYCIMAHCSRTIQVYDPCQLYSEIVSKLRCYAATTPDDYFVATPLEIQLAANDLARTRGKRIRLAPRLTVSSSIVQTCFFWL